LKSLNGLLQAALSLWPSTPSGFGSAGIRRHRICGAIIIAGGPPWSDAQRGVETDETGINIAAFTVRYYLAVNEKLPSNVGEPRARALSDDFSRDISLRGEVLVGGGGVLDFTIGTDCALANDVDTFGTGTGSILLDEATETQERAGWRTLDMRLSSDPQLVL
jgi:hypothetical protein